MKTKFLLAGLLCAFAFGQVTKPNFSGTWKLNTNKSDPKDWPADRPYVLEISQTLKTVTVTTKAEGVTNILDGPFPIDAKYHIVKMDKTYRWTRVSWENATLVFEILDKDGKKDTSKVQMGLRETWIASPDGAVMTRYRRTGSSATPGKVADQKYVFEKQKPS